MGALAPISPWNPEDDFQLKNAVEAGASLESLAKGAVRFSQRYSIHELHDRWHSLLYDPDVSAEAADRMAEVENSASNLSSKANRSFNSKRSGLTLGKKNVESVRSLYHSRRKRICSEPRNSINMSLGFNCTTNEGQHQEQLMQPNEIEGQNCMFREHTSNHFGLPESDLDIMCDEFPEIVGDDATAGDIDGPGCAFDSGHLNSLEGGLSDGVIARNCLYGVTGNNDAAQTGIGHSFEHNNVHKDIPLQQNATVFGNCTGAQEIGTHHEMPVSDLFETGDLETKPLSLIGCISNNPGHVCSGFGGSQCFNSGVSDYSAAFHQLGYSSTLPTMPVWGPVDGISTSAMQIKADHGDKGQVSEDALACTGDGGTQKVCSSNYQVVPSEPNLAERIYMEGLTDSTAMPEGNFLDIPSSLLNFAAESELLFMDVDVKDMMDRSCLDGLNSICSPGKPHHDDKPGIPSESKALEPHETCLMVPDDPFSGEFDDLSYQSRFPQEDGHMAHNSVEDKLVSISLPNPHSPEFQDGVICCKFNTEDPEVPDNDDIFPSAEMLESVESPITQQSSGDSPNITASFPMEGHDAQNINEHGSNLAKGEEEAFVQRVLAPRMIRSQVLTETGPNVPVDGCGFKSDLPVSDYTNVVSNHIRASGGKVCRGIPMPVTPNFVSGRSVARVEMGKQQNFHCSSLLGMPGHGSNHAKSCPQNIPGGYNQEEDVSVAIHRRLQSSAETDFTEMAIPEPGANPQTSDHEEQLSESDGDVPYFSDVEAMILDMDLDADDQESYFSREVLRYQNMDTKRAIIRLEQAFQSHMQRAMASHGAFAIFYGRHLKHYIKKSEVLLGRATEDVDVDIDLGREGRANKISRRQAMIKMDEDGSFYLKNLGKSPILVNSKEVETGQRLTLNLCCLIEIRGMRFMFEKFQGSSR